MERNPVYRIFRHAWVVLFLALYILFSLHFRRRAMAKRARQGQQ